MKARLRLACALFLAILPASLYADTGPEIESFALKNGLEVIVIPNHRLPAVSHMIWYKIGAADDPRGKSGLAHFHEHTMFLGTANHKGGEYARIIARHGGQENAFTGHDATSYYIDIAKEELPLAMELEADRMRPLMPTDEAMIKEKQVILEERRMRIENSPDALLSEQMNAALFRNHPYHWPVIGWMREMEGLTKEDVLEFHKTWYHPNNAILILSGDVTAKEVKPLVEKYYGALPSVPLPKRIWTDEPPQLGARRIILHHKNVKQPSWSRSYVASSFASGAKEDALPLFLLSQMLGEGKTSRLYQTLVVERKLASRVDSDYDGFSLGPSQLDLTVVPEAGVDMATLEKAIDEELARVVKEGFSDSDLARSKTLLKSDSIYARDGLSSMARIMGWIRIAGLPADYFAQWPKLIDAITLDQVKQAAAHTINPDASVTGLLLPIEAKEAK